MKTKLVFLFLFINLLFPNQINAEGNFVVDGKTTYKINKEGKTSVQNIITIENKRTENFAKEFVFVLNEISPKNISVREENKSLNFLIDQDDRSSRLKIVFDPPLLGKNKSRTFVIEFEVPNIAVGNGEIWEISIPKLSQNQNFREYEMSLYVPKEFGEKAYITPDPIEQGEVDNFTIFKFDKNQLYSNAVNAVFGKFQVFSFNISYHLENNQIIPKETEVAIPPDTNFQKVYYDRISPPPVKIRIDEDGNWLASYRLGPKNRLTVNILGNVQIFANPVKQIVPNPTSLLQNLKPTNFWQSNDEKIMALAKELKTPKEIYDFVKNYLRYNYDGIGPDARRLGAVEALKNPDKSLCTEFTDLFIAIARAAGIPAREINGFAYTQNPKIQPLSLVSDILHSWPEYWDSQKNIWVGVDPTWASTSGMDYFENLDLKHIAFVIHGKDSTYPLPPGSYKFGKDPQKDIFISFAKLPQDHNEMVSLKINKKGIFNILNQTFAIEIKNDGKTAKYDLSPKLVIDSVVKDLNYIKSLPPYSSYKTDISLYFGPFALKSPRKISLILDSQELSIYPDKIAAVAKQLTLISILIISSFLYLNKRYNFIKIPKIWKT